MIAICPICQRRFETGIGHRPAEYCSAGCKQTQAAVVRIEKVWAELPAAGLIDLRARLTALTNSRRPTCPTCGRFTRAGESCRACGGGRQ